MGMRKTIALACMLAGLGTGALAQESSLLSNTLDGVASFTGDSDVESMNSLSAQAQHEIFMVEGRFYPETTYLVPGDTVIFVNMTDADASAKAADDSWTTGSLPIDGTFTLEITADTHLTFNLDGQVTSAITENLVEQGPGIGYLSFDPAPAG